MKRAITASSKAAQQFGDLYDSGDFQEHRDVYEQMDEIMNKWGSEDDHVDEVFDKASPADRKKLMALAQKANARPDEGHFTEAQLKKKFTELWNKTERDHASEFERGYFEAMCDLSDTFGLNLDS